MASRSSPRSALLLALLVAGAKAHGEDLAALPICAPPPAPAAGAPPNNVRLVTGAPYSAFGTS
jgi:hypothetical protein